MRRSASEIIRNLEMRVARLEKQSKEKLKPYNETIRKIEREHRIKFTTHPVTDKRGKRVDHGRLLVRFPEHKEVNYSLKTKKRIKIENDDTVWELKWRHRR